jgi:cellobiose transport system permease protein
MSGTMRSTARGTARGTANGGVLEAGWVTYLLVGLVTLVSVFPLYYTIVMASHTNAEMASSTPPILPNSSVFGNLS